MAKIIKVLSLALVLAALFVFFSTGSVFADDGSTPPVVEETAPPQAAAEETPPVAEAPVEAAPVVEEAPAPVAETPPVVEESPAPAAETVVETLPEELAAEPAPLEEPVVVEEIPAEAPAAEAPLVLVDESGAPLTLATVETAQLLSNGDPYFWSLGVMHAWAVDPDGPDPLTYLDACPPEALATGTCQEAFPGTEFQPILAAIASGMPVDDKKIHVLKGSYTQPSIEIDGSIHLINGLEGEDGNGNEISSDEITLAGTLSVRNMKTGFTLSGFTINNSVTFINNTGTVVISDVKVHNTAGTGISITDQNGAVTLTDVDSSENAGRGAEIDNTKGVFAVTVSNAAFDDNQYSGDGSGLIVNSKGAVTVNGVSASRNKGQGTAITTTGVVSVKNSTFSDNIDEGLSVLHAAITPVTLENLVAEANGKPDQSAGIWLRTQGPVSATQLTARWNGRSGMVIEAAAGIYPNIVSIIDSSFYSNNWSGLYLKARGNVTFNFVNANSNGSGGVFIDNCLWTGSACVGTGAVTLLNPGLATTGFNSNGGHGLEIDSAGAVTITGYRASSNGIDGFYIKNNYPGKTGGVTINALALVDSATAQSWFNGNGHNGVTILSNGAVAINANPNWTMRFDRNGNQGISIGYNSDNYIPASVSLKGIDMENNANGGLEVYSKGAITLTSVAVNAPWANHMFTDGMGLYLNNPQGTGGVTLTDVGVSYVSGNGIYINSKGAVTLTRVNTFRTGGQGIYIFNSGGTSPVTLTEVDVQQAHSNGIYINSRGKVSLSGVNANNTGGAQIDTAPRQLVGTASSQTWFNFFAHENDTVLISIEFKGYGSADLFNASTGERLGGMGTSYWSEPLFLMPDKLPNDGEYFIFFNIDSDWQEDFEYTLTFTYNGDAPDCFQPYQCPSFEPRDAILIDNESGITDVSITGSPANPWPSVSDNSGSGIRVFSSGAVTVNNQNLHRNGGLGVSIVNQNALTAKTVTVNDVNISRSGDSGLYIDTIGSVAMKNIYSTQNGGDGIKVDNCYPDHGAHKCRGTGAVSLLATLGADNYISHNQGDGVSIFSIGLVTINNLNAEDNQKSGLKVDAPAPTFFTDPLYYPLGGGVTLTSLGGYWNRATGSRGIGASGVSIYTYGPVSLTRLGVDNNSGFGLKIDNKDAKTAKAVTLNNVDANNNDNGGIIIDSLGVVTLNGVAASTNYLRNQSPQFGKITKGVNFGSMSTSFTADVDMTLQVDFTSDNFHGDITLYDTDGNRLAGESNENWGDPISLNFGISAGDYHLEFSSWEWQTYEYAVAIYDQLYPLTPADEVDIRVEAGGLRISTAGDVNILTPAGSERWWYNGNTGAGIEVISGGNIKLDGLDVTNNHKFGIDILGVTAGKTTTISNLNVQSNGNSVTPRPGINVVARGAVTLTNLAVQNNKGDGVTVNNCTEDGDKCLTSGAVTLNATPGRENYLDNNNHWNTGYAQGYGLRIYTVGAVTLSNFKVQNHASGGVSITKPAYPAGSVLPVAGVTINASGGYWNQIHNSHVGLFIDTYGPVSLSSLDVNNSGYYGIQVTNDKAFVAQPVTLTNVNVANTGNTGIDLTSKGNITLNGVTSSGNYRRDITLPLGYSYGSLEDWPNNLQFAIWDLHFHVDAAVDDVLEIDFISDEFEGDMRLTNQDGYERGYDSTDFRGDPLYIYHTVEGWEAGTFNIDINSWTGAPYYYYISISSDGSSSLGYTPYNGINIDNCLFFDDTDDDTENPTCHGGTGNVTIAKSTANPNPGVWGVSGTGVNITTNGTVNLSDLTAYGTGEQGVRVSMSGAGKTATLARVNAENNRYGGILVNAKGAITLSDSSAKNSGSSGIILNVTENTGAINVARVSAGYSKGLGFNQGMGIKINALGPVTLTDVRSWFNEGYGIRVETLGAITLTRVSASHNLDYGAFLANSLSTALVAPGVTLTDSTFERNSNIFTGDSYGLTIFSRGPVRLLGVDAVNNYQHGFDISSVLSGSGGTISGTVGGYDLYLDGFFDTMPFDRRVIDFPFTLTSGLLLDAELTPRDVDMRLVILDADGDWVWGSGYSWDQAAIYGLALDPGNFILRVQPRREYYDGSHAFANPGSYVLRLQTSDSTIGLEDMGGASISTSGAVTVDRGVSYGPSNFSYNGGDGLNISIDAAPGGNVLFNRTYIQGNQVDGLELNLDAAGRTTTLNNLWLGNNREYNAYLVTQGAVNWTGGESRSSAYGVEIRNANEVEPYTPQAVTISNVNFSESWEGSGLWINSYGNVSLTSVGAWGNRYGYGVFINNCQRDDAGCLGTGSVSVNNSNGSSMDDNDVDGLHIESAGNVAITNLRASWNGDKGIYVNNAFAKAAGGITSGTVTITYTQQRSVDNNGFAGIWVDSNGAIRLTATKPFSVFDNGKQGNDNFEQYGIYLDTDTPYSPLNAPVTIEGLLDPATGKPAKIEASNNIFGIKIYSKGAVTVKNVSANWNRLGGVEVYTYNSNPLFGAAVLSNIIVNGTGWEGMYAEYPGYGQGVVVFTTGPVTLTGLDSNQNWGSGLLVVTESTVSLSKSIFKWNGSGHPEEDHWGAYITAKGDVTLNYVVVNGNDNGLHVDTSGGTGKVTLLGTLGKNEIIGNHDALQITSAGSVALNRLDLKENTGSMSVTSSTGNAAFNTVNILSNTNGMTVTALTGATFTKVVGLNNGIRYDNEDTLLVDERTDADGIHVTLTGNTVINPKAVFTDCGFTGNTGNGIEVIYTAVTPVRPTFYGTNAYFGNNSDGFGGDANLYYH